jgi:glycosyltransferase involved in cell wall biosynthesis
VGADDRVACFAWEKVLEAQEIAMLLSILNILLDLGAVGLVLGTVAFALQAGAAIFLRDRPFLASSHCPSIAVLVPAHNEEQNIEATLHRIKKDLSPRDHLLVVADNCVDQTALLAMQGGAEVVVRNDFSRRGKGFALAAGLRHLALAKLAPEVVVFVDADCQFSPHGVELLARACAAADSPVQSLYLMLANPDKPAPPRFAEFAWRIKNDFRPNGYARIGMPCHLLGSGMAVPWRLIEPALFATGHLTEDLLLGIELAINGSAPRFFRGVRVTSYFPDTQHGRDRQKQRWVHGHFGLIGSHLPRLVYHGLRRRDLGLLAMAADLAVPPLSMLVAANIGLVLLCFASLAFGGSVVPLAVALLANAAFAFSLMTAWHFCGRDLIGLRELKQLPSHLHMVARAALNLARGHRAQWVRTDRSHNPDGAVHSLSTATSFESRARLK